MLISTKYSGPPFYLYNGNLETIWASKLRKTALLKYHRETIITPDQDFLNLDWSMQKDSDQLAVLIHGYEGHSERTYMRAMSHHLNQKKWSTVALNLRSCGGPMNKQLRMYHHGEIDDLATTLEHINDNHDFKKIVLVGFSLGGSIILKYLGVKGSSVTSNIVAGVSISAPADIEESSTMIQTSFYGFYRKYFMEKLIPKLRVKAELYPDLIDKTKLSLNMGWDAMNEIFMKTINGFRDADHFYREAAAVNFVKGIQVPTLMLNAKNDPILGPKCSPVNIAKKHTHLHLELAKKGGHTSFLSRRGNLSYAEERCIEFIESI